MMVDPQISYTTEEYIVRLRLMVVLLLRIGVVMDLWQLSED